MGALIARSLGDHGDLYCAGGPVESLPPHDCEVSLLSLPLIFGTEEATIPGPTGYLRPDPAAAAHWRERLAGEKRLKVGLAWTGSLTHKRNPYRRVGLERFAQHFTGIEGVAFYSLQPGAAAEVARRIYRPLCTELENPARRQLPRRRSTRPLARRAHL